MILVAIEACSTPPILQRKLIGIPDAEPALLGRVDQEQAAERPERLATKVLLAFLIDDDDALAGVGKLGCGNKTGKARTHHDHIGIVSHCRLHAPPRD